jgi:replicative DNA helicase
MKIIDFIKKLEQEIEKTEPVIEKENQLERLRSIVKTYEGSDKIISSHELANKIKTRPEEFKMLSGWKGVDDILKGFRLKQLITIAAPTKSGKTSFCVDLTSRLSEHNPTWFPFEEGAEELIQKYLDRNENPPLFYTPQEIKGNTLVWIEERIIESIIKYNTKVVFIDHLHFIVPFSAERSDLRIGETMRALKGLAKKWNITIFIIAHLKKTKLETQPDLEDLRDSSFIAQESDTVIMLWRETKREDGQVVTTNNVNVSVQANRRTGKTGNVKMIFNDGKFTEFEWISERQNQENELRDFAKF